MTGWRYRESPIINPASNASNIDDTFIPEHVCNHQVSVYDSARFIDNPHHETILYILGKHPRRLLGSVFGVPLYLVSDGDKILSTDHNLQVEAYHAIKSRLKEWGVI